MLAALEAERPDVCVIDSVQTLDARTLAAPPGPWARCARSPTRLMEVAKRSGIALLLVGHVTKEGALAGPRVLEHLVDCRAALRG